MMLHSGASSWKLLWSDNVLHLLAQLSNHVLQKLATLIGMSFASLPCDNKRFMIQSQQGPLSLLQLPHVMGCLVM